MSNALKMRTFPISSSLFSALSSHPRPGGPKTSLPIPRSTKSSELLEMLSIFACFVAGLYVAIRGYGFALGLLDAQLPRVFAWVFCVAYGGQLGVGWLEFRAERLWREEYAREVDEEE